MNLVPFSRNFNSLIDDVEQHWHKLVDNFFTPNSLSDLKNKLKNTGGYPRIDAYTKNDSYVIQATVPGVNPDDLVVEVFDHDGEKHVRLSGQVSDEYRVDEANWTHKEIHRRAFSRVTMLPDYIDGDPDANVKDGIITLTWKIPKKCHDPKSDVKRIALKKG